MTRASDLMTEDPVTVTPATRIKEAARLLYSLDIRHLPVVDDDGTLVGMLSDRDLRGLTVPHLLAGDTVSDLLQQSLDASVSTLMTGDVLSVEIEDDVADVVELMLEHKIGAVPVVDGDGGLVGIVSYMDVLRSLPLDEDRAN